MRRLGVRAKLREFGLYPKIPDQPGVVAALSRWSWRLWSMGSDNGPISKTGLATEPLAPQWAKRFLSELDDAPADPIRVDDRKHGYFREARPKEMIHLNGVNDYRAVTPSLLQTLREFLAEERVKIDGHLGHSWRVASVRQFYLRPSDKAGGMHLDAWPPSIRKLFILPGGATPRTGTTRFGLRDGNEIVLDRPDPLWAIFEPSRIRHALTPGSVARPTIELDIVPALRTSLEPCYAGVNGWYPLFPWV